MPTDDLYDDPEPVDSFGRVFMAVFESECGSCEDPILPGEDCRSANGLWIHADTMCEKVAREQ